MPTAQTYQFVRYGKTPVHLYNGNISLQIPVYEYVDPDFRIPVSLSHVSQSHKPQNPQGILGVNWFLNAGGVITREVRGVPDDVHQTHTDVRLVNSFGTTLPGFTGFLVRKEIGYTRYQYSEDQFYDKTGQVSMKVEDNNKLPFLSVSVYGSDHTSNNHGQVIETESDIYRFNFGEHSGTFVLDGECSPQVFNTDRQGEYKVNIDGYKARGVTWQWSTGSQSVITITTGDGYVYRFGGTLDCLEYTGTKRSHHYIDPYSWYITAWYLTEITAPNGRKATFKYNGSRYLPDTRGGEPYHLVSTHNNYRISLNSDVDLNFSPNSDPVDMIIGPVYLSEIQVDGKTVFDFTYYNPENYKDPANMTNPRLLTGIRVLDTPFGQPASQVKQVKIAYEPRKISRIDYFNKQITATDSLYFPRSISLTGEGTYQFTYYHPSDQYPSPNTTSIDHWGYWNDRNVYDKKKMVPEKIKGQRKYQDDNGDQLIDETGSRAPNGNYALYGLLKKVTYPTGGSSEFVYEPHDYALRLERTFASNFFPRLESKIGIAGGARIASITDNDSFGNAHRRRFFYRNSIHDLSPLNSSGNLLIWPRYYLYTQIEKSHRYLMQFQSLIDYAYDKNMIEYARVIEVSDDDSYIVHDFSNYTTDPDEYNLMYGYLGKETYGYPPQPEELLDNIFLPAQLTSTKRGLPTAKRYYDDNDRLLREEIFGYTGNPSYKTIHHVKTPSFSDYDFMHNSRWLYPYLTIAQSYHLTSRTVREFIPDTSGSFEVIEETVFNAHGQESEVRVTDSGDSVHISRKRYATETVPSLESSVKELMQRTNIIAYPLEIAELRTSGDTPQVVRSTLHRYQAWTSDDGSVTLPKISRTERYGTWAPVSETAYSQDVRTSSGLKTEMTYERFDDRGNLLQTRDNNGIVTSYVWGYGNKYIVAKIEGLAYQDIPLSGYNPAVTLEASQYEQLFQAVRTDLRNAGQPAQVTSYTYLPLIGLRSLTDPSGRKITYQYDDQNRLAAIRDENGHVLESYQYHIIHE